MAQSFTHELVSGGVFLGVLVVLFLLRRVLGTFGSTLCFYAASLAYLKLGFVPGVPASLFWMCALVALLAILLYVTSSEEGSRAFFGPIRSLIVEKGPVHQGLLVLLLLAIPLLIGRVTYSAALPSGTPPPKIRSIHPAPPSTIDLQARGSTEGRTVDVVNDDNPYRSLEATDPRAFAEMVARGKVVYYENCFYCHGDTMAGDGHFAGAVTPVPAKFQAPDTIPMLTETFLFWRVAKGGPGLPAEGTPYDSTMPVWENFLSEEDMWACIMFLYDYTGYRPRTKDTGGH